MFVRPQKVVIRNPESKIIVGAIIVIKAIGWSVGFLVSTVKAFNHLLVWAELCRYCIVVRKSQYLSNVELKALTEMNEELLGSQRICYAL